MFILRQFYLLPSPFGERQRVGEFHSGMGLGVRLFIHFSTFAFPLRTS